MGINHSTRITGKRKVLLAGMLLAVTQLAVQCHLDRMGTAPPYSFSVEPSNVCPGDMVTVSWEYQGGQQPSSCSGINPRTAPHSQCRTVEVTQDDGSRIGGPTPTMGERSVSVDRDTTFSFQAFDVGSEVPVPSPPATAQVHVVEAPEEGIFITYEAGCTASDSIAYHANQSVERTVGECVSVTQVCNESGERIEVHSEADGASDHLEPGGCTPTFSGIRSNLEVDTLLDPVYPPGMRHPCTPDEALEPGEERAPLNDIMLRLLVTCQIPSGSPDCAR